MLNIKKFIQVHNPKLIGFVEYPKLPKPSSGPLKTEELARLTSFLKNILTVLKLKLFLNKIQKDTVHVHINMAQRSAHTKKNL